MTDSMQYPSRFTHLEQARSETLAQLQSHPKGWSLPQHFYTDPLSFQVDLEQVFYREWLFAGMASQIPNRGDYITLTVGTSPVLLVRDATGEVRGYHNVCRHRGSKLCVHEQGKVANLTCPYHQWTYNLQGELLFTGTDMGAEFDPAEFQLKSVHCRTAGGMIFICLASGEAPEIDGFLADLEHYMEPYQMAQTRVAMTSTIIEEANWKLVIENNRECYHCNGSHPQLLRTLLEWDDVNDPRATPEFLADYERQAQAWDAERIPHQRVEHGLQQRIVRMPLKSGTEVMTLDGKVACQKLLGRVQNRQLGSMRILHLPNSWHHMQSDHLVVFRVLPLSAQRTAVTTQWLVHQDAVAGVDYDEDRLTEVWRHTNDQDRELAEQNQRGIRSISYQPGPYAPSHEFGVINFIEWYRAAMLKDEPVQANLRSVS